jgi:hypothetical protein
MSSVLMSNLNQQFNQQMSLNNSGSAAVTATGGVMSSLNSRLDQQLLGVGASGGSKANQKSSLKASFKNVHVYRECMMRSSSSSCGSSSSSSSNYFDFAADQCLSINYVLKKQKSKFASSLL